MGVPKISIITPSYNQAKFIEKTIKSVLSQNYPNLEYIVVDGGSKDGTVDILKKYNDKIKWISEKDNGQVDAINKGIKMSSGDIVAYMNSDDVYNEGTFLRVSDYFNKNKDVMWVVGKCRVINTEDAEIRKFVTQYKNFFLKRYNYSLLLITNFISQPATFFRRQIFDEFGLFSDKYNFVMDYEYWLRIGYRYKPGYIDEYLSDFRVHNQSKGGTGFKNQFKEELSVAKSYSKNPLPILLHYLNYIAIITIYSIINRKK